MDVGETFMRPDEVYRRLSQFERPNLPKHCWSENAYVVAMTNQDLQVLMSFTELEVRARMISKTLGHGWDPSFFSWRLTVSLTSLSA